MMIRMRFSIHPIKEEAIPNAGDLIETEEGTDDLIMKDITGEETKKDNMKTEDIPMEIGIIETTGTDKETKVMAEMTGMSSEEEVITPAVERLTKGLEELPVEEAVRTGMKEAPTRKKSRSGSRGRNYGRFPIEDAKWCSHEKTSMLEEALVTIIKNFNKMILDSGTTKTVAG